MTRTERFIVRFLIAGYGVFLIILVSRLLEKLT